MSLVLVGVIHRDPEGEERLIGLLEELGPDGLSVELSPWGLLWRERKAKALKEKLDWLLTFFPQEVHTHPHVAFIKETLRLPYEYTGAVAYASPRGVPVHLVDLNWISRNELPLLENEILTLGNISLLVQAPKFPLIAAEYRKAVECLSGRSTLREAGLRPPWTDQVGLIRERFMACRVRRLSTYYGKHVHIGGWVHLVEENRCFSLAWFLRDLAPSKILLGRDSMIRKG